MSKQLNDTELLELADKLIDRDSGKDTRRMITARDCMRSLRDSYVDAMTLLSQLVADHLEINTTGSADWHDADTPLVGFTSRQDGQTMPPDLEQYDPEGEFE